ncbi:hypothetical protein [Pseudorhodobacter sp.]|uniref:hypothetical protein n=1 Tax=Pseudorhodobacter sp. TaxID=1934400 RepID=UPI00264A3D6A|nr:hypothetical protein [Pseudorhodobacter sp.]MDN5786841.1 hypothetical protein [Pseudorhodobacter sp.]
MERNYVPHKHVKQLNWYAEWRNAFKGLRVFWHGRINLSDSMETFGISLPAARPSQDQQIVLLNPEVLARQPTVASV